jgi:hypothetical protein
VRCVSYHKMSTIQLEIDDVLDVTEKQTRGENNVNRHAMQWIEKRQWKGSNGWKAMMEGNESRKSRKQMAEGKYETQKNFEK